MLHVPSAVLRQAIFIELPTWTFLYIREIWWARQSTRMSDTSVYRHLRNTNNLNIYYLPELTWSSSNEKQWNICFIVFYSTLRLVSPRAHPLCVALVCVVFDSEFQIDQFNYLASLTTHSYVLLHYPYLLPRNNFRHICLPQSSPRVELIRLPGCPWFYACL